MRFKIKFKDEMGIRVECFEGFLMFKDDELEDDACYFICGYKNDDAITFTNALTKEKAEEILDEIFEKEQIDITQLEEKDFVVQII